jgi:hypothetical protein
LEIQIGLSGAHSHFRTGLCRRNSLLTGKTTGNFDVLADGIEIQRATQEENQRVAEIFPAQRSRDFLLLSRESQRKIREATDIRSRTLKSTISSVFPSIDAGVVDTWSDGLRPSSSAQ